MFRKNLKKYVVVFTIHHEMSMMVSAGASEPEPAKPELHCIGLLLQLFGSTNVAVPCGSDSVILE
jgi:hypothetical protein